MSNIIDKIQLSGVTYDIGGSGGTVSSAITSGDTNAVAGGAVYDKFDEVEQVTAAALNDINDRVSEDEEVTAAALNVLNTNKQDKLSAGTGISISGNVISATGGGGGNPTVELTQAEYDALVSAGTVSADTYYIITDATPVDMSNYYTSAQTNTLLAGKQDTLSAGRGISISSNVVSFSLPISAGTGTNSIKENNNDNIASGQYSHAEGCYTIASGRYSHAEGFGTIANNDLEHTSGYFNVSNTGESISAQTLFSVGNGSFTARHNAFEIRQNGDIYIVSGGTDIKLQDHLGGTVSTAITSGDTNAVAGGAVYDKFNEVEQVTAQALNVLNESLSGKQDTLEAGRGISVTTGATADTISVSLPISAGTGMDSIREGYSSNSAGGNFSHAEGYGTFAAGYVGHSEGYVTIANGRYSHAEGSNTIATNDSEHASGQFNVSNKANNTWGDSGNTLFSVGNGANKNSRHNAFEIRQNGDIYLSSGGTDIKLQDYLGGGGSSINVVQTTGTSTADVMSQDAVSTQLNNKANNTAAVGSYQFGATSNVDCINFKKVDTAQSLSSIYYPKINGKGILTNNYNWAKNNYDFQLLEKSAVTSAITSSSTDAQVPSAKAVNDKLGGLSLVKLTQAQYDALATKDNSTLYVIVG